VRSSFWQALVVVPIAVYKYRIMAGKQRFKSGKEGSFVAVIADEDTVTGFLLAGVGEINRQRGENFLVVDSKTPQQRVVDFFRRIVARPDIAVVLIAQHVAQEVRWLLDEHAASAVLPTVLEIPSPAHPYVPEKDSIMLRIQKMLGQS